MKKTYKTLRKAVFVPFKWLVLLPVLMLLVSAGVLISPLLVGLEMLKNDDFDIFAYEVHDYFCGFLWGIVMAWWEME